MSKDSELAKALQDFKKMDALVFPAKVTAVDEDKKTITVEDIDGLDLDDVRLSAAEDDAKSVILVPKINSTVLVCKIGNDITSLFVVQVNEVDKILGTVKELLIEDETGFKINLKDGLLTLNGDGFNGIVKADELKTQIDKNTAILQALQNAVQAWVPVSQDGGAAFKAALSPLVSMLRADLTNIKNNNIKHG